MSPCCPLQDKEFYWSETEKARNDPPDISDTFQVSRRGFSANRRDSVEMLLKNPF
jgi:hypothetical protein